MPPEPLITTSEPQLSFIADQLTGESLASARLIFIVSFFFFTVDCMASQPRLQRRQPPASASLHATSQIASSLHCRHYAFSSPFLGTPSSRRQIVSHSESRGQPAEIGSTFDIEQLRSHAFQPAFAETGYQPGFIAEGLRI